MLPAFSFLLAAALCAQEPPRLLYKSPALGPLLDRHLETKVQVVSSSGRLFYLSAQGWEQGDERGAYLVFHRPGGAAFGLPIDAGLFCLLCRNGGALAEPEPGSRFRVKIAPKVDEIQSVLTIEPDGADAPAVRVSVLELFEATAEQGLRFPVRSAAFGGLEGSLAYYFDLHEEGHPPVLAFFFGAPLNVVRPVPVAALPVCADANAVATESTLWVGGFRRLHWRIGARRCGDGVELYELPVAAPITLDSIRMDSPTLEELRAGITF